MFYYVLYDILRSIRTRLYIPSQRDVKVFRISISAHGFSRKGFLHLPFIGVVRSPVRRRMWAEGGERSAKNRRIALYWVWRCFGLACLPLLFLPAGLLAALSAGSLARCFVSWLACQTPIWGNSGAFQRTSLRPQ